MIDFTTKTLLELYKNLLENGYRVTTFSKFLTQDNYGKICILRHDVDRRIESALSVAELENKMNLTASYYFRYPETFDENVIKKIHALGHEIGYHYEVLAKTNGDYPKALELFKKELSEFKKLFPVDTVCAHGSPFSKWDNKNIFKKYKFADAGIMGDAYLSVNFNEVYYLTDTGRSWSSSKSNIRDKVDTKFYFNFHHTQEIIYALKEKTLPDKIMLNVHPNRWNDNMFGWCAELVMQNIKNIGKKLISAQRIRQNIKE